MAEIRSVAIFGASGNVGDVVVPALLKSGLDITVVTRQTSTSVFPSGVKIATADYTSLASLTSILKNIDAIISLVGPSGFTQQALMVDAAVAAGVKYFIPSEFGHDTEDSRVVPLLPAFGAKNAVVDKLKSTELEWTGIITGLFFDWGLPLNMFDVDLKARKAKIWDGGDIPFNTINIQDIASAVVSLITNPIARATAKNRFVHISSFETTQNEILAAAEEITCDTFEITKVDGETLFKNAESKTDDEAVANILKGIAFSGRKLEAFGDKAVADSKTLLTGPRESVKETVKRVLEGKGPAGNLVNQIGN